MERLAFEVASEELALPESVLRLRVLIDGRKLLDGGIGTYTRNLIEGLLELGLYKLSVIAAPESVSKFDWCNKVEVIEDRARGYSFDEYVLLPRRLNLSQFDLYHSPHYTLPFGLKIPALVTVHDLIHIYHAEKPYYPYVAGRLIRSALKRANSIITVSASVREDIRNFVKDDADILEKVQVIPNAIDPFFLNTTLNSEHLSQRFRLHGKYFLSVVSLLKAHKGVSDLLTAFAAFKESLYENYEEFAGLNGDIKLILVGAGTERLVEQPALLEQAGSIRGVHVLGSVSREDLLHLYAGAHALVVPSLAEGFCLPVIEAQALGTQVLARPVPAIKELIGPRDLVARDFSVEALKGIMLDSLRQHEEIKRVRTDFTPLERLKRFDRGEMARKTLGLYTGVLDQAGPT